MLRFVDRYRAEEGDDCKGFDIPVFNRHETPVEGAYLSHLWCRPTTGLVFRDEAG